MDNFYSIFPSYYAYVVFRNSIIFLIVAIIVLLILREFWCWYWKIHKRLDRQDEIIDLLKEQNRLIKKQVLGVDMSDLDDD